MSTPSVSCPRMWTAPAKLNLGLHVLRRRADGFHDIETVLLPIGWHDVLHARPTTTFDFTCSDPSLPTDERNLAVRAVHAFEVLIGRPTPVELHLDKHLPHGAGLGGGSSDAATVLRLLRDLFAPDLPNAALHPVAVMLGSDVPFFLYDEPMLGTGRGEVLEPLGLDYAFPFAVAVVMPPVSVATAEAYGLVRPSATARPDLRALVRSNDLDRWRRELVNDFEGPVLDRYPAIRQAKQGLVDAGASYATLSGSGAAVFGVFENVNAATEAADVARAQGLRAWAETPGAS